MKKIFVWFANLFNGITGVARKLAHPAVLIVELIKDVVNSYSLDRLVKLTPSPKDDEHLAKLKAVLPGVLIKLGYAEKWAENGTNYDLFKAAIKYLQSVPSSIRWKEYLSIAVELINALNDGKLSIGEIIAIVQSVYETIFKGKSIIKSLDTGAGSLETYQLKNSA